MVKRQFLDFLYSHPQKHKKLFKYKHPVKGYSECFSPLQLLKEVDQETEIGKKILENLQYQEKVLRNFNMFSDQDDFVKIIEDTLKENDFIPKSSEDNI